MIYSRSFLELTEVRNDLHITWQAGTGHVQLECCYHVAMRASLWLSKRITQGDTKFYLAKCLVSTIGQFQNLFEGNNEKRQTLYSQVPHISEICTLGWVISTPNCAAQPFATVWLASLATATVIDCSLCLHILIDISLLRTYYGFTNNYGHQKSFLYWMLKQRISLGIMLLFSLVLDLRPFFVQSQAQCIGFTNEKQFDE